jgi:hypothetical protein
LDLNFGEANPAVLLKYSKKIGKFDLTVFIEDIANAGDAVTSGFIPLPKHVESLLWKN